MNQHPSSCTGCPVTGPVLTIVPALVTSAQGGEPLLKGTLVDRLGWTLVHSLWALAAALLVLVLASLRRRPPNARYLAACGAMAAMLSAATPSVLSAQALQAPPATGAGAGEVDAPALVREVRAQEAWVARARSVRMRFEGKWVRTPRGVEQRRAELRKQFPGVEPTAERFSDLVPEGRDVLEIGFDRRRVYSRWDLAGPHGSLDVRVWDGRRAVVHETSRDREHYALDKEPQRSVGSRLPSHLMWLRAGPQEYWWVPKEERLGEDFYGRAEDFVHAGRRDFRGVPCHVLESDVYHRTFLVGVADGRLRGIEKRACPPSAQPRMGPIIAQVARAFGGEARNAGEFDAWAESLPEGRRREARREYFRRLRPLSVPRFTNWYADYKELAPGRWAPVRQGFDFWEQGGEGEPFVASKRELTLVEAAVDRPLPEEWFKLDLKEGVQVHDWGHEPPLHYMHKKTFTPQEWQAILHEANAQAGDERQRKAAMDAVVGKAAPAFPAGAAWLNGRPLNWADLAGKVVILDFWAAWCGPCRNDFPTMVQLHKEREQSGVVVIGVHAAGTPVEEIEKTMKLFGMEYPVCLDIAPGGHPAAPLFDGFAVSGIPHAFVVDRRGKVAAHGTLAEAVARARALAAPPPEAREPSK